MRSARSSRPGSSTSRPAGIRSCTCRTCTTTSCSAKARPRLLVASERGAARPQRRRHGDYKFSILHFEGVRSGDTNVGVEGTQEVAGGLLGFSTTTAPPAAALQESQDALLESLPRQRRQVLGLADIRRAAVPARADRLQHDDDHEPVAERRRQRAGRLGAAPAPTTGGPPGRAARARSLPPAIRSIAPVPRRPAARGRSRCATATATPTSTRGT